MALGHHGAALRTEDHGLYVSGSGARSDVVCHITADVFGLPVKRIQTHEACSIGSSMAGSVSMGVFRGLQRAAASMVHVKDTFEPDIENRRVYMEIYKRRAARSTAKAGAI